MTDHIRTMRDYFIVRKEHHGYRQEPLAADVCSKVFAEKQTVDVERAAKHLCFVLEQEQPVVFPEEKIALLRTVPVIPEVFTEAEMDHIRETHWIQERGSVCNINVDYMRLLKGGFAQKRAEIYKQIDYFQVQGAYGKAFYLEQVLSTLDAVSNLMKRYREQALAVGNQTVTGTLERVPEQAPQTFLEALQMFRILHFTMWCGDNYHNTIGRLDQYLYPYFKRDLENGCLTEEEALELLEEFFLTFNRDSDLYPGIQQGDNGQSMVLGGINEDGTDSFNLLSELCLKASLELRLIDPKINLRVSKNTPLERYRLGTELTKQGLGFPQYANDDVVIQGLLDWGYEKEDAYNYVVAACWEFIVPGRGMDIPNIDALSFAGIVQQVVEQQLESCCSFEELMETVKEAMKTQLDHICAEKQVYIIPAPFLSLMMEDCIERAVDISKGSRYNNYGIHGVGLTTAVDTLAAIRQYIFDQPELSAAELCRALREDFAGNEALLHKLRYQAPKMGNDDDRADDLAVRLLDWFADLLQGRRNDRGGLFRAGTGSAMYYIWHSKELPATADGRRKGEGLSANYSPSLFSRINGPVSMVKSFAKPHLSRVANGGPLTLELHDTLFRNAESMDKVAQLVKSFIDLGGHQLQINAVNREEMLDAQKHPENHRNLIVRVWGWSGYFVELDKEYQDHIIQRMEFVV